MTHRQWGFVPAAVLLMIHLIQPVFPGQAAETAFPGISPDQFTSLEQSFFEDLSDGTLRGFDPYDAFLIASGIVQADAFSAARQRVRQIRKQALAGLDREADPYSLGKTLLFRLHDQVFKEYDETASAAGMLLDQGKYNCLSSSILYYLIARDLGLAVSGALVPGHTFCVLSDPRGDKVVETTVRYGFDPGQVEVEQLKRQTRYVYVPETVYTEKKTVTWRELMSLLYTNNLNLAGLVVHDDYADYLPRFRKALLFDPANAVFEKNMVVCLNNLVVLSLEAGRWEQAQAFIQEGKSLKSAAGIFEEFEIQYYNQAAIKRADTRDYRGAVRLIREGLKIYPGNSVFTNNLVYFYETWAASFVRQADHAAAVVVFLEAMAAFPENKEISKNLRIAFYNQAAHLYNSQEYDQAVAVCREALSFFPGDDSILGLMTTAQKRTERETP
jgi:tetratricopeptide (TPR) repeat protein